MGHILPEATYSYRLLSISPYFGSCEAELTLDISNKN